MPLISIIIPVYNLENYLSKCLDTITNQTYKNIEIICINDGSTDNSLKVLKEYVQKDNRIKIINQNHFGPSKARNIGIKNSSGEYIVFVDGDDWIENNLVELAYNKISKCNADIVIYGHNRVEKNQILPHKFSHETLTYYENKKIPIVDLININHCIWDRMFRKKFLTDNNILFPEEIIQNEDGIFNLICLYYNPRYCCLPNPLYNYRPVREVSIMTKHLHIIGNDIKACKYFLNTDFFKNASFEYKSLVINKFIRNFSYNYKQKKYRFYRLIYNYQLNKFMKYLSQNLDKKILYATEYPSFKDKHSNKKYILENLFSVKNETKSYTKRKCVIIFFIQFNFKINTDKKEVRKFNKTPVKNNSILIIEANRKCHGETIPGLVKILSELGYNTDIIVPPSLYKEKPFCRLEEKYYNSIFQLSYSGIEKILKSAKIKDYKYVFFNSYHLYYGASRFNPQPIFKHLSKTTLPQNGFIALEHHLDKLDNDMNKEKRVLQLGNIKPDVPFCNSHYFGKTEMHEKNSITKFVIVGEMISYRKDSDLLIKSLNELTDKNIKNFHIDIIGNGKLFIPESVKDFITFHGRLPFNKMFSYVESSDFILTLLDPNNDEHMRYINDGTSGTFQLAYGFLKPILIHSKFAKKHYFNENNAIIYKDDFVQAMEKCINMSNPEYSNYVKNLDNTVKEIEEISLNNLKYVLEVNNR